MFKKLNISEGNLLAYELEGEIDESGIELFYRDLKELSDRKEKVRLYLEFKNFKGWDGVNAFELTMKSKLMSWGKIGKYAVVTDTPFLHNSAPLADFITPNYPVKVFSNAEKQKAIDWIQEPITPPELQIELMHLNLEGVVGFVVKGKLGSHEYEVINKVLAEIVEIYPEVNLLVEITNWKGWTLAGMWDDFRTGIEYYRHISKFALISGESIVEAAAKVSGLISPKMKVKHFAPEQKQEAINWLSA